MGGDTTYEDYKELLQSNQMVCNKCRVRILPSSEGSEHQIPHMENGKMICDNCFNAESLKILSDAIPENSCGLEPFPPTGDE